MLAFVTGDFLVDLSEHRVVWLRGERGGGMAAAGGCYCEGVSIVNGQCEGC